MGGASVLRREGNFAQNAFVCIHALSHGAWHCNISMSRIAIAVPAIAGHLNPATTLGRELLRRGHHVTVFAFADGEDRVRAAGLEFGAVATDLFPKGAVRRTTEQLGTLHGFKALRFTVRWFKRG